MGRWIGSRAEAAGSRKNVVRPDGWSQRMGDCPSQAGHPLQPERTEAFLLSGQHLLALISNLLRDHEVIAPVYEPETGCVVMDRISSPDQMAMGYRDQQGPGRYAVERADGLLLGYANGPRSPKDFLHPSHTSIFSGEWHDGGFSLAASPGPERPYAFVGTHPCDCAAIQVLDRVFLDGTYWDVRYRSRRTGCFVVAISCTEPGDVCFCASMGTGPRAKDNCDLRITEIPGGLVAEPVSESGFAAVRRLSARRATHAEMQEAYRLLNVAVDRMGRTLATDGLPAALRSRLDHPYWEVMGRWCLGCTNCTAVCPTCFCNDFRDHIDLRLERIRRERVWDSCFTRQFAEMAGWNPRDMLKHRYRHWCLHKLSYWVEQYGVFGCVGCGRCITWCPVGIDITAVAAEIRRDRGSEQARGD